MINSGLSGIASGLAVIALGTLANCSFNFLGCSVRGRFGPVFPQLCGELDGEYVECLLVATTGAVILSLHGSVDIFWPLVAVLIGIFICVAHTSLWFGCTNCMVVP